MQTYAPTMNVWSLNGGGFTVDSVMVLVGPLSADPTAFTSATVSTVVI